LAIDAARVLGATRPPVVIGVGGYSSGPVVSWPRFVAFRRC
jgi:UDP-N-acetylglucosamine:LPS N-acetylglucosamine transferase